MKAIKIILFIFLFTQCTKHKQMNSYCDTNHIRLIKKFSKDVLYSKLNTIQIIEKYFYKPEEILNDASEIKLLIYEGLFLFPKRYLIDKVGYINVFCGVKMLNSSYFNHLFDIETYKNIVSICYYNKKFKGFDIFSFYIIDDKIYSIMPLDDHQGGVYWMR